MKIRPAGFSAIFLAVLSVAQVGPLARCAWSAPAAPAPISPEADAEARQQLGERFCDLGLSSAAGSRATKSALQETAALVEAATLMNPSEPRFFRLLALVREGAHDVDGAVDAWSKYRNLVPDDEIAQISIIDLYMSQMQANDAKLKYLRSILARGNIVPRVKAHAAALAVPLLNERSPAEARAMLVEARRYYPLPEVTEWEWLLLPSNSTPAQQIHALLNILRTNPMRADVIVKIADMLAVNGLSEESLSWYAAMLDVHRAQGTSPELSSVINYLTERYRAGETTFAAEQLDGQVLTRFPDDPFAWFLRLTIARNDESAGMLRQAQGVFLHRVDSVASAMLNVSPAATPATTTPATTAPATAPATTEPSELTPLLPQAIQFAKKKSGNIALSNLLNESLVDLAWFELYFDHNPKAAEPALAALKELLPADNVSLRNLIAWYDMLSDDEKGARVIFETQQDSDALSALGLFRLEEEKNHHIEAATIGSKIASHPHTGVLGAILWEALKGHGFKPTTQPSAITDIKAELDGFPKDWLQVVRTPSRFYSIRAEPILIGHRLGDPMLATVTLENSCKLDLTVSEFGLIKPMLVFDAQIRGTNERNFPAIATDRLMGRQVLSAGESISQVMRIDQGELSDALRAKPAIMLLLNADIVTNVLSVGQSSYTVAAGGYVRRFNNMFTRTPAPLSSDADRRQFYEKMAAGSPMEKMLDIELMAAYINEYVRPGATRQEQDLAQQFANVIDKYRSDPAPGVKLWASYIYANFLTGPEEQRAIGDMLQGKTWDRRMLALVAARRNLPAQITREIAARQAATDTDPLVKFYATAIVESLKTPATQPARIPTGK